MCYTIFSTLFLVLAFINQIYCLKENYYWREYEGSIPNDAVKAGKDKHGKDIYIGQAYVKGQGLIPVQINPGVREVYAARLGIKRIDKYIKILCGPQENFYWKDVEYHNLYLSLLDQHAVIAGHQDGLGILNVGEVNSGEMKIGKVEQFNLGSAYFFYNDNGQEKRLSQYKILMYNNSNADRNFVSVV